MISMAYCRFSHISNVYMYRDDEQGEVHCGMCNLASMKLQTFNTRSAAIRHLRKHRDQGDEFPEIAIDKLVEEIAHEGDLVRRPNEI